MFNQLDLEGVSKSAKEMGRASNFHDFLDEELHYEKRPKFFYHI
jgi:hypothetical protein